MGLDMKKYSISDLMVDMDWNLYNIQMVFGDILNSLTFKMDLLYLMLLLIGFGSPCLTKTILPIRFIDIFSLITLLMNLGSVGEKFGL